MDARKQFEAATVVEKDLRNPRVFAMVIMVIGSVVISFSGLVVRNIEAADPWQINVYRSIAFVGVILVGIVLQNRNLTVARIRGIGIGGIWAGFILGIAGVAFMQALTYTTVANTMFTMSAIPFISSGLAGVFLSERLPKSTLVAMIIAAIGVFIMVIDSFGIGSGYGNFMAIVTAVCFSVFSVAVRHYRQTDMVPSLLIAGAFVILVGIIASYDDLSITVNDLLLCFLWGGVLSALSHWIFIVASRHLVAAELTLFMLFEFALAPFWVWQFIGESPTSWGLIGGMIVICSVAARAAHELMPTN